MMVQKTCKILMLLILSTPLSWGLDNFSNNPVTAQEYPVANSTILQQPGFFGQQPCLNGRCPLPTRRPAPPARRDAQPRQQPRAGVIHAAVVATRSSQGNREKHGYATAIKFDGNFYLVSCAHVWGGSGWTNSIISKGQRIPVEILGVAQLDDLAVLKCPGGLQYMPLSLTNPVQGSPVNLGYRPGTHAGFRGTEIVVQGYVKEGDSGGPIFNKSGLVGIIATYEYVTGTNPQKGRTSGPSASRIAAFIKGLKESPPSSAAMEPVPEKPAPVVAAAVPAPIQVECDLEPLLARISKLEQAIKDNTLETQRNKGGLAISTAGDAAQKKRLDAVEQRTKDAALGLQRITGVVEVLQKEVETYRQQSGNSTQTGKDAALRIQRLEQSVATLTKTIQTTEAKLKGKLRFKLRVDQAGRVVGVESQ